MILKDFIKELQDLVKQYPQFEDLPVAYSSDDEGNSYHLIYSTGLPIQVENPTAHNLELVGYFNGDEDDIDNSAIEDINIILIN